MYKLYLLYFALTDDMHDMIDLNKKVRNVENLKALFQSADERQNIFDGCLSVSQFFDQHLNG